APDGRDRDRRIRRPRPPDDGGHAGARPGELNPRVRDRRPRRVGAVASPPVDVLVLGPLEVRRDGEPVTVRRGRPRRLLISLLLRRGGAVSPATLIDQLWGDDQPVNADNALQLLVSSLRRALAGTGAYVERTTAGYRLVVDPDGVDAFRFERLVRAAQATGDPGERSRLTADALALWRGTP